MRWTALIVATFLFVVVGTIATLVWWRLADRFFPDASRKTGQWIGRRPHNPAHRPGPPPGATVITPADFAGPVDRTIPGDSAAGRGQQ